MSSKKGADIGLEYIVAIAVTILGIVLAVALFTGKFGVLSNLALGLFNTTQP